ncbi:hypothetical protein, partial [Phytoactinopolyspora halotolerans]|uniref:hypothetical protein n=1 Tax=Phytoactinopolyspora halotolerans TaxID=1981512 RepID=UPI001C2031EC
MQSHHHIKKETIPAKQHNPNKQHTHHNDEHATRQNHAALPKKSQTPTTPKPGTAGQGHQTIGINKTIGTLLSSQESDAHHTRPVPRSRTGAFA